MPTNAEYLAQGKTQEEINKAVVNKNSQAIATKLGQTYDPTSGQFNVTPAAPVAPPVAPSDIGGLTQEQASGIQDIYKENIAEGMTHEQSQAAIKADPNFAKAKEAFNAPVAPVTPTPEVVTPKPTKDVTSGQKTAKNEGVMTQAEYDKSQGRELEIQTNLTTITAGNPALLTDRSKYNDAFKYETADAGKKAFLDSFFNEKSAMMTSPDAIFKQLSAGMEVSPAIKNSPAYKTAQVRLDSVNKFSAYTPTQISQALITGDIRLGTQSYKDLAANPVMKQKLETAQKLNAINGVKMDVDQVGAKLTSEVLNSPIGKALADNYLTQEEKDALINTGELRQSAMALQEEELRLNVLESEYKGIEDDIRKKMEGTGASSTDIAQMIANAQKTLRPRLELAQNNYSTNYGFYTEKKQDSMALFTENLGMYKDEKKAKEAKSALTEQRTYDEGRTTDERTYTQKLTTEKRQYDSINAQLQFAQENGIPMVRSDANVILAEAQAYAKGKGVSMEQAIKDTFTTPFTAKSEYKTALKNIQTKNSNAITPYEQAQLDANKASKNAPVWQEWEDSTGKHAGWITPGVNPTSSSGSESTSSSITIPPSGTLTSATLNGKHITMDGNAMKGFTTALANMPGTVIGGQQYRTKEEQAQLVKDGKSWTMDSKHRKGLAVDIYSDNKLSAPSAQQIASMNANGWYQPAATIAMWDTGHFEYTWQQATNNQDGLYVLDDYVNKVRQMSGGTKGTTDKEIAEIRQQAKGWKEEGLTPQQGYLRYAGYKLNGSADGELATTYLGIGDNLTDKVRPKDYASKVSEYLNKGETSQLNTYVNTQIDRQITVDKWNDATNTSDLKWSVDLTNSLADMIEANQDKIGAFDGNISNWMSKVSSDPDLVKIKTNLQQLQAQTRKVFAGSAVTATEMAALRDFIGGTETMDANNLITQLKQVQENNASKYFAQRVGMELPEKQFFITDQGVYSKEGIDKEIEKAINNGVSEKDIKSWLDKNNITY